MKYLEQQKAIIDYIKANMGTVLAEASLSDFDAYIDDVLDLNLYNKPKQMFFDFGVYNYENLSNETESETFSFNVYIVFQKNKRATVKEQCLKYSAAFYEMFDRSGSNFGGIADVGRIESVAFYPGVDGNPDIKAAEITVSITTEK